MDKFLTVEEVASKLQVHWQTVLKFIKTSRLRAVKLGRGYRIDPDDFNDFIEKMKTKKII